MIAPSADSDERSAVVLPDLATCPECLREIFDPDDRRYRYPFTTCSHCGPRYSIIAAVPYDRARTTMRCFPMCAICQAEYDDPGSRRFHAETNACPDCGPQLALWDAAGNIVAIRHQALCDTAEALRRGQIVALKGLGGFQLLVDARNEAAVRLLRVRKRRPAKPFAVMVPTSADAMSIADVSPEAARLLCSSMAPIVLLRACPKQAAVAPIVAPANPQLGIMLPYTPLHHLLMKELGFPVVATSGNQGDEPIVADEREALRKLTELADLFLVHDRPILRPVDDLVVRMMAGRETVVRLARGYAPQPLVNALASPPGLALGGHQKSAVAVGRGAHVILGPHVGDLDGTEGRAAFARMVDGMTALYGIRPERIACDVHPNYHSSNFADGLGALVLRAPHHLAHVLAGMLDNGLDAPVLGVAWDGTGYGGDGTIWGGEFLAIDGKGYRHVAQLTPFRLPGAETAVREPRRAAVGALYATFGATALAMADIPAIAAFEPGERRVLAGMLARGVNAPLTSSAGRLFDAVAAILGLQQKAGFEGEAAMAVEFAADRATNTSPLASLTLSKGPGKLVIDWRPLLATLVDAVRVGVAREELAAAFHDALAEVIVSVARCIGIKRVLLTGGCFQNARLVELTVIRLREDGFDPYWHHRIPPNDGGLAAGQIVFAARPLIEEHD